MAVSYKRLWKLLVDKDMKKVDLKHKTGITHYSQSNATVQAVVAVADEEQFAKIICESAGVLYVKTVRTWNSDDVLSVCDFLTLVHESVNKLAFVPESF